MAKNVERIFTKLQALCDEKLQGCELDFSAHAAWLHGTFKANALEQLKNQKVELACPTSTKKIQPATRLEATPAARSCQQAPQWAVPAARHSCVDRTQGGEGKENKPCGTISCGEAAAEVGHVRNAFAGTSAGGSTDENLNTQNKGGSGVDAIRAAGRAASAVSGVESAGGAINSAKSQGQEPGAATAPRGRAIAEALGRTAACSGQPKPSQLKASVPNGETAAVAPNRTLSAQEQLSRLRQKFKVAPTCSTPAPAQARAVEEDQQEWKGDATKSAADCAATRGVSECTHASTSTANSHSNGTGRIQDIAKQSGSESCETTGTADSSTAAPNALAPVLNLDAAESLGDCSSGVAKPVLINQKAVRERAAAELPAAKKLKTTDAQECIQIRSNATSVTAAGKLPKTSISSVIPVVKPSTENMARVDGANSNVSSLEHLQNHNDAQQTQQDRKPTPVAIQDKLQQAKERRARIEQEKEDARKLKERARACDIGQAARAAHGEVDPTKEEGSDSRIGRADAARAAADTQRTPVSDSGNLRGGIVKNETSKRSHPEHSLDNEPKRSAKDSKTAAYASKEQPGADQDQVLMPPPPPSASKKLPMDTVSPSAKLSRAYHTNSSAETMLVGNAEQPKQQKPTLQTQYSAPAPAPALAAPVSAPAPAPAPKPTPPASTSATKTYSQEHGKKPAKKVPEWASGAALQEALRGPMMYVDPDEIFGPVQTTCDLQEIFEAKRAKYTKRSSSGNWIPDRTTWQEEMAYKKEMGLKKGAITR